MPYLCGSVYLYAARYGTHLRQVEFVPLVERYLNKLSAVGAAIFLRI